MIRMPETSVNLPIPTNDVTWSAEGRVLRWPRNQPEGRMSSPLFAAVTAYIEAQCGGQGLLPTPIGGVNIIRSFQEMMPMRQIYRPSLCVGDRGPKYKSSSARMCWTTARWNASSSAWTSGQRSDRPGGSGSALHRQ